jgi:hypothetical protein
MSVETKISTLNSTTDTLAASATYTGSWEEVYEYASISIIGKSDAVGTLFAEFSTDGETVSRTIEIANGGVSDFGIHSLIPVAKFFRVRLVNDSVAQTTLDIQVILNTGPRVAFPTSRVAQNIGQYSDVLNTRVSNDYALDTASGLIAGRSSVHKFGENPDITASSTEDLTFSGTINWLTAGDNIRVKAGGNAADAAAGAGAQKVFVEGLLSSDWTVATEEITLNADGTLASASTSQSFIRVYRAYVTDTGTYTGVNTGNITLETDGGTELIVIPAGLGQSESSAYTVPAGKTAYITRFDATVDSAKAADVVLWQRQDADDVTTPFSSKRQIARFPQLVGPGVHPFPAYVSVPEKTDLWVTATTGSGANTAVETDYDLVHRAYRSIVWILILCVRRLTRQSPLQARGLRNYSPMP